MRWKYVPVSSVDHSRNNSRYAFSKDNHVPEILLYLRLSNRFHDAISYSQNSGLHAFVVPILCVFI